MPDQKDSESPGLIPAHCGYRDLKSYQTSEILKRKTYKPYIEECSPEVAANTAICVIHQTNYLLNQQLRTLEKDFVNEGGFTERLYRVRTEARKWNKTR